MYAIIATGGKQYKVTEGESLQVEKLDAEIGAQVEFDQVLMLVSGDNNVENDKNNDKNGDDKKIEIGTPYLLGAKVVVEVVGQGRGDKINIIKFRRRKHYMRHKGHRQDFTEVKVKAIYGT